MDFSQQHVVLVHAGVAGQDFSELSYIGRLVHAHANFDLPWLLGCIKDVHEEIHLAMILRDWHWHAQKGVEGVRLPMTSWTSQARPELCLEYGMHEGVVTANMIRQSLSGDDVIRPAKWVLKVEKEIDRSIK